MVEWFKRLRRGGQDESMTVLDDRVGGAMVPYDRAEARTVADRNAGNRAYRPPCVVDIGPIKPKVLDVKIRHTYPVIVGDLGAVVIASDEVTVPVGRSGIVIGRSGDADIQIPGDDLVSRLHARLTYDHGILRVQDLRSTNGTYLNGREVRGRPTLVRKNSSLGIGTSRRSDLKLSY